MEIRAEINGRSVVLSGAADERLRDVLYRSGYTSVRDSDDREGFAGSDTIIFNDRLAYSNLILLYQAEGASIRTPESLMDGRRINDVQQAMIDAGVVQSAYNAPEAALILTYLLERNPDPSKDDIKNALSGIFIRDAGYEHYYLAVQLVREKRMHGSYRTAVSPSFRSSLRVVGKPSGKIDAEPLVRVHVATYINKRVI